MYNCSTIYKTVFESPPSELNIPASLRLVRFSGNLTRAHLDYLLESDLTPPQIIQITKQLETETTCDCQMNMTNE